MAQISKSVSPSTNLMNNESSITCDEYYHGNVWDDHCIQSLNSPYGAPAYQERAEMLIKEIKPLFWSDIEDSCCNDLIKRLEIVDTLECLAIDRHFQAEIKVAMDYVYRCWNERGIGEGSRDSLNKDLHATALGFRALRLHRYNVSSGVLEKFKDESGRFCSFIVEGGGEAYNSIVEDGGESFNKHVRCMLSLLRAANISFPGEKVMAEAKAFTTNYLKQVLAGREATHVDQSLLGEVKYALEFPWHCSVPRLEARSFIEIYGQTDSGLKSNLNQKILELAKLDFNILQSTHQKEMQIISRWFADSNIAPLNFYRKRHVEIYFWMVTAIFEAEFCASRIAFTKHAVLMTMLDDLYDIQGTVEQLKIFTEGVRRWDLSLVESLPDYMKTAFEFFIKTANELIAEASKEQGRDLATYIRKNSWERYLGAYLQEAEWIESGHIPTFDEYMKNGKSSAGMCVVNLVPLMLMGEILPLDILEQIYSPSRFHELLELAARLVDDAIDFEDEKDRGEFTSCVEVYLHDHPGSTVADALNHVNGLLDNCLEEIHWEFLKHDSVPLPCKKYTFNTLARGVQLMYHFGDGFSITDKDIKDQVRRALIDPVPI